jgi:hypothetical protein
LGKLASQSPSSGPDEQSANKKVVIFEQKENNRIGNSFTWNVGSYTKNNGEQK